jgi:hypothetical protein
MLDHRSTADLYRKSRRIFPRSELVLHVRVFGHESEAVTGLTGQTVRVYFWLPTGIVNPIALNDAALSTAKKIVTQTWLRYQYGPYHLDVPPRYSSDGGSIPWLARWIFGYEPFDDDVWAYLPHDLICEHPEILPRGIGDAILGHVLEEIAARKKARRRDALRKFWAVRLYTRLLQLREGEA